jgi:hypothetical protein
VFFKKRKKKASSDFERCSRRILTQMNCFFNLDHLNRFCDFWKL